MKLLLILSHAPFAGDIMWNALRLAETSIELGYAVNIFVMNDAVDITRKGSKPEGYEFDLGAMLLELQEKGAAIKLCTTCIQRCGIARGEILDSKWLAGMKDLAQWIAESDKVVTF